MTITVGFLVFPGIQLLDLAGPYEFFWQCTRDDCGAWTIATRAGDSTVGEG